MLSLLLIISDSPTKHPYVEKPERVDVQEDLELEEIRAAFREIDYEFVGNQDFSEEEPYSDDDDFGLEEIPHMANLPKSPRAPAPEEPFFQIEVLIFL